MSATAKHVEHYEMMAQAAKVERLERENAQLLEALQDIICLAEEGRTYRIIDRALAAIVAIKEASK